ncbi:serine hydrolase domain-containing protein [Brevibacillus borstelensis]|uniref:serine hydrolase domain-containing protein n=1 Tax=Brevibacillus borstelensis TaxID=45462 RepID=UPI0030C12033
MSHDQIECILRERLKQSLETGISQGIFPGGIAALARAGLPVITVAAGKTEGGRDVAESANGSVKTPLPVDANTMYDMASLTKVMVTLPLVLLGVQEGRLSLTDSVTRHLPELEEGKDAAAKRKITLLHLLTHTSGLPAWRPFFLYAGSSREYLRLIADEPMTGTPGQQVVYSDLGFMLLGFTLERVWDEPLDQLAQRLIFQPSGMTRTCYLPLRRSGLDFSAIAPTEDGNAYEHDMARQQLIQEEALGLPSARELSERLACFAWRRGIIRGTVHDCNAYYGLGGVSGHAGLFSTSADTERYMRIWTSSESPVRIDPILRATAIRSHTGELAPMRALGWEASATGGTLEQMATGCTGGDVLSSHAFGHTGFTGTSIWRDPVRGATLIALTNRVHPTVSSLIGTWRRSIHNQLFSLLTPAGSS